MLYFGGKTVGLVCIFLINNTAPLLLSSSPHPHSDLLPCKYFRIITVWSLPYKVQLGFWAWHSKLIYFCHIVCSSFWLLVGVLWVLILSSGMAFIFPPLLISTDLIRIESIFIQGLNKVNKTGQEQSSRARRIYLVLLQYKKLPVALSFSLQVSLWRELAGERAGHALWQWWAWPKQSPRWHIGQVPLHGRRITWCPVLSARKSHPY